MRGRSLGWSKLRATLGFVREKRRGRSAQLGQFARWLKLETLEGRRVLSAVTVSTYLDFVDAPNLSSISDLIANPGTDGKISLREAILAANSDQGADMITFGSDPADGLNGGTIALDVGQGSSPPTACTNS